MGGKPAGRTYPPGQPRPPGGDHRFSPHFPAVGGKTLGGFPAMFGAGSWGHGHFRWAEVYPGHPSPGAWPKTGARGRSKISTKRATGGGAFCSAGRAFAATTPYRASSYTVPKIFLDRKTCVIFVACPIFWEGAKHSRKSWSGCAGPTVWDELNRTGSAGSPGPKRKKKGSKWLVEFFENPKNSSSSKIPKKARGTKRAGKSQVAGKNSWAQIVRTTARRDLVWIGSLGLGPTPLGIWPHEAGGIGAPGILKPSETCLLAAETVPADGFLGFFQPWAPSQPALIPTAPAPYPWAGERGKRPGPYMSPEQKKRPSPAQCAKKAIGGATSRGMERSEHLFCWGVAAA